MAASTRVYRPVATLIKEIKNNGGGIGWEALAERMARIFESDNPRFDSSEFLKAIKEEYSD